MNPPTNEPRPVFRLGTNAVVRQPTRHEDPPPVTRPPVAAKPTPPVVSPVPQHLRVRVLAGTPGPELFTIHAGPTNSGKTYESLDALARAGRGVYAGPLRMLAREAHTKLVAMLGPDMVGLVTGEEQENPNAPIICATAEAAPLDRGGVLVLDECHWISDPQRGWAWTRLLVSGQFDEIHAITDPAAVDLLTALVPDAEHTIRFTHDRLATLTYAGTIHVTHVPEGTAIVAFSRAAVLALAATLKEAGRNPAVLYGALPPVARAAQIELLTSGKADVIVTTDVIGHGINLPLTAVALAQTEKFDGEQRRELLLWEAAQILGRAGRFGHGSEEGRTFSVTGLNWFTSDPVLVANATQAAAGLISTGWLMPERAAIRPTLGELGVTNPFDLADAVAAFTATTTQAAEIIPIQPFNSDLVLERLDGIISLMKSGGQPLPVDVVWNLAMCPIDDPPLLITVTGALLGHTKATQRLAKQVRDAYTRNGDDLETAERAATVARNLRAVTMAAGDLPGVSVADAARLEARAGTAVVKALSKTDATTGYGTCPLCGEECPPWYAECQSCRKKTKRAGGWNQYAPAGGKNSPRGGSGNRAKQTGNRHGGKKNQPKRGR